MPFPCWRYPLRYQLHVLFHGYNSTMVSQCFIVLGLHLTQADHALLKALIGLLLQSIQIAGSEITRQPLIYKYIQSSTYTYNTHLLLCLHISTNTSSMTQHHMTQPLHVIASIFPYKKRILLYYIPDSKTTSKFTQGVHPSRQLTGGLLWRTPSTLSYNKNLDYPIHVIT